MTWQEHTVNGKCYYKKLINRFDLKKKYAKKWKVWKTFDVAIADDRCQSQKRSKTKKDGHGKGRLKVLSYMQMYT